MSKHTPGPWRLSYSGDERLLIDGHRGFVCEMNQPSGPEREANARLIVAAPDLLTALIRLVSGSHQNDGHLQFCRCPVCEAKGAIAKATAGVDAAAQYVGT